MGNRESPWRPPLVGAGAESLCEPDHTRTTRSARRIKSALVSYRWERIRSLGCISSHTTAYVNVNVNDNVNVNVNVAHVNGRQRTGNEPFSTPNTTVDPSTSTKVHPWRVEELSTTLGALGSNG